MDKFFIDINDKIGQIIKPYWDKVLGFFNKEYYVLYAVLGLLLVILLIPGLFTILKRAAKFFFFILILFGAIIALWYFFVIK